MRLFLLATVCFFSSGLLAKQKVSQEPSRLAITRDTVTTRIEKSLIHVHDILNTIQDSIVNINVENNQSNGGKQIQQELEGIKKQLHHIYELLLIQKQVLGNLQDEAVESSNFTSIEDINNAELSLVSLLKSIYLRQLEDDLIIS